MIAFEGATKRLDGRLVLDDVTFEVYPGEADAVVGAPGCGKSMLLRCLTGLVPLTHGRVEVLGYAPGELRMPGRLVGVGLDPSFLHPGRSAREVLFQTALMTGADRERSDAVLERLELDDHRMRVKEMTADQRQRLAIGVALVGRPAAIALDMPLSGLDESSRGWFRSVVEDLTRRGGAVLVTADSAEEVEWLVDGIVVMDAGRAGEVVQSRLAGGLR